MAAAERNDLMKNIDRWVIGASMTFCASRPVKQLFVRLSKDSVRDKSLLPWLQNQLKATRVDPQRIAFQVSEQVATEYLADTTELATGLRRDGFRFALEHFGTGRDPHRLLAHLPVDFIKVDGTLMQGLAVDQDLQQRVRDLVDQAKAQEGRARSPSASKTPTPWRCCGSSASSSSRATSSTSPESVTI